MNRLERQAFLAAKKARKTLRRLSLDFIRLATLRAPKGGIAVQGEFYNGGQFIPNEVMERATPEEKAAIEQAKQRDAQTADKKASADFKPAKAQKQLATAKRYKAAGHEWKMFFDARANSRGFFVRHKAPDGTITVQPERYADPRKASEAAISRAQTQVTPARPKPAQKPPKAPSRNYRYAPDELGWKGKGKKGKFKDNLEALRILRQLEIEDRQPTDDERGKLAKFVGWGQMSEVFNSANRDWAKEREELQEVVGRGEFQSASRSTANSHYTHPDIVKHHWAMARRLGFKGGNYLEPAVGSGFYIGFMPEDLEAKSRITAIELDQTTGGIAKALYPDANVKVQGFQETPLPTNHFDLVATNVPFDNETIILTDRKFKKFKPTLHDYYFLKSVDVAKPGGLIMHITSAGTMDKLNPRVREQLAKDCELVSAVRYPGGAHSENAGTQVVTDMIILRKKNPAIPETTDKTPPEAEAKQPGFTGTTVDSLGRLYHWRDGKRVPAPKWDQRTTVKAEDGTEHEINEYFAHNPEQMLGKLSGKGSMYRAGAMDVEMTDDYTTQLLGAIDRLPKGALRTEEAKADAPKGILVPDAGKYYEGQLVNVNGAVHRFESGQLVPHGKSSPNVIDMIAIREAARELMRKRLAGEDDTEQQAILNELYDNFVAKYGPLNKAENRRAMKDDSDFTFLLALEQYNATTGEAAKADMFSKNTVTAFLAASSAGSAKEAVGISLHEFGKVDATRVAELLGVDIETAKNQLVSEGVAFIDPESGTFKDRAIYLSGDVRKKLRLAKAAAETDPAFAANVEALEAAQPEDIPIEDIGLKLGTPWIRPELYMQFAAETVGVSPSDYVIRRTTDYKKGGSGEDKGEEGGVIESWEVGTKVAYAGNRRSDREIWGVKNDAGETVVGFNDLLKAAMNGKSIVIRSASKDENNVARVLQDKTDEAREKVQELKELFSDWLLENDQRREEVFRYYNDNYNNIVPTEYDGSHLTLPGMRNTGWPLRDIQKNFVHRVITTGRGLAAHEVGTGKTASMVAAAMELRRLGLAKKPAIVCTKATVEQIAAEAQELYPNAKILSTADMFDASKRQKALNQIATGDYDMIVMTHDHLNMMRLRPETRQRFLEEELEELREKKTEAERNKRSDGKVGNRIVKALAKAESALTERLKAAMAEDTKDQIYFEDSGIDQIFVDEAHLFKSLPCVSSRGQVKGVPTQRSQRATNMLARCRYLLEKNNGRGVVFATGTPIANTMAELFNMQRYLQYDTLKERGLHRFDAWAETFGERTTSLEFKLNGDYRPVERFNKFVNLPELRHLASEFMDVQRADNLFEKNEDGTVKIGEDGSPVPVIKRPKRNQQDIIIEPNDYTEDLMKDIHSRANALSGQRMGKKGEDNMLTVCNDAKKGSIDPRMLDSAAEDNPNSKANRAVAEIVRNFQTNPGTAQAIFSDIGVNPIKTPSGTFSLFADIKRKLVAAGIPKNQIVNFSEGMTDEAKQAAQAAIRRGDVRIAFGSTATLGTGVNIHKRLKAVHHLDIPYVPAFLEQRDGRAYRHGNTNKDVDVYRYTQQGSADNIFWTIVANKRNFIDQFMLGSGNRTMVDLDTETLTPQQMIAVATGDTEMMERVTLENEVRSLQRSRMRHQAAKKRQSKMTAELPSEIAANRTRLEQRKLDQQIAAGSLEEKETRFTDYSNWRDPNPISQEEFERKMNRELDSYSSYPSVVGTVRGFKVLARSRHTGDKKERNSVIVEAPNGLQVRATPTIAGIEYAIRSIAKGKYTEQAERALADAERDYQEIQRESEKGWQKEEELKAKSRRLAELQQKQQLKAEGQVQLERGPEPTKAEGPQFTSTKLSLRY